MHIIIIDDEPETHTLFTAFLESKGFEVHSAYNGQEGIVLTQSVDPDLVILDVAMPGVDGWQVCAQIRAFSSVPVLMVSAHEKEDTDIVEGLNVGADDYVEMPVSLPILEARINALLRRSSNVTWRYARQAYIDSHLKIDLHRQEVMVGGKLVSLSSLEYRMLELLVSNADRTVTNPEIIDALWENVEEDHVRYVRIYIGRLRKILEPEPRHPTYIITEHGFGYRFNPQV